MFWGSLVDLVGLNSVNLAYQSDSSGFVAIIGYLSVVYSFLVDEFVFNAPISFVDVSGALFILMVTVSMVYYKLKLGNNQH